MNLRRVSNQDKVAICRKYYLAGFFVLPFVWVVNSLWFFNDAFRKAHFEEQGQIRSYVIRSIIGSIIWIGILVSWQVIFQLNRASWGIPGENLSMILPGGMK